MAKNRRSIRLMALALSIPAVLLLILVAAGSGLTVAKADSIAVQEHPLDPAGVAFEVNPDTRGNLWISDDGANQVWQFHPATGVVTTYTGLANASDARMDPAGMVWWTNAANTDLGRISPGTSTMVTWTLPGTGLLWGISFDDAGRVWITDFLDGMIYRFTPGTTEACTYAVPDTGASNYILAQGADIWLGDWLNRRLLKLDPSADLFTIWQLTDVASPMGMAMEANGNLWWADEQLSILARLEPGSDRMTAYALPVGAQTEMVALSGGKVWYTEYVKGTVGMLDPAVATGVSATLVKTTAPVTPTCSIVGAGTSSSVPSSTRTWASTLAAYRQIVNSGGWSVYQMPPNASPWGIAVTNEEVWVVDQGPGRQKLAHLLTSLPPIVTREVYLPLIVR
jgi:streptogramin lyase